ncbi:MAG: DUF2157 domain-containing protein [Desulfovibrionales bacterium]
MATPRSQLIELIERGALSGDNIRKALYVTDIAPDGDTWRRFIDQLFVRLGGLAIAFSVLFFVAANWNAMGRFAKFGMVEGLTALSILGYCLFGSRSTSGRVCLLAASILVGVLLALCGQVYQTGADPWQLFFTWGLLMFPWAILARYSAILLLWVLLMNLSIVLYHREFGFTLWSSFGFQTEMLWLIFLFNTLVLIGWEFLVRVRNSLNECWAVRIVFAGCGFPMTWLVLDAVFGNGSFLTGMVWIVWISLMYFTYRKKIQDLFMVAGICLSAIVVIVSFAAGYLVDDGSAGGFLMLAFLVVALGAGTGYWLKRIQQEYLL